MTDFSNYSRGDNRHYSHQTTKGVSTAQGTKWVLHGEGVAVKESFFDDGHIELIANGVEDG